MPIIMRAARELLWFKDSSNSYTKRTSLRREAYPTVLDWLHDICPSQNQSLQYLIQLFPFLNWIKHYNLQWLVGDLVAGINPERPQASSHL